MNLRAWRERSPSRFLLPLERLENRTLLSLIAELTARGGEPAAFLTAAEAALMATPGAPVGQQPTGALTGRIIYTAAGHGYIAANTGSGSWSTQRPLLHNMVEDFGNQDQMTQFVHYAWNAGATIVPTRPVGHQPHEVVLDNTDATFSGTWTDGGTGTNALFFSTSGPGVASRYKFATGSTTETAVATYAPNLPAAGFYPVYSWAAAGSNRVAGGQVYRVVHSAGKTEVKVDHRKVGGGWVYLGTFHFDAGTSGSVEIPNRSTSGGAVIADAIRFGNGMGDIDRGGGISGHTREDEATLYWIKSQADNTYLVGSNGVPALVPASEYRGSNSADSSATVAAPPRWAEFMNNEGVGLPTDRMFLSFHTNASGNQRGTIGLYNGNNDPDTATPNQRDLAMLVAREVNDDLVALSPYLEFAWFNRTGNALVLDRSDIEFGEINNTVIDDEFDATLLEVAFHDHATDAALLRAPKVRQWVGRSSVQGVVRYFNQFGGGTLNFAPDAPVNVRATTQTNGDIELSWSAPPVVSGGGSSPTGYLIESSTNGYSFDGGIVVSGGSTLSYTIPAAAVGGSTDALYFRIVSTNAGGWSPPSEVAGARAIPSGGGRNAAAPILIVNGFDRFDRTLNPRQTASIGTFERVRPRSSNSFDYVVQAGEAIEAYSMPLGFDSAQNEAVVNGQVNLADYQVAIWLSGEESTADVTFSASEQSAVTAFVNGGGKFFVSGSEIGWNLVAQQQGAAFFQQTLRAQYVSDDANTYNVTGTAGSIFEGLSLSFDNGSQFYDVDFPDRLAVSGGSTLAMSYIGGLGGGAATQWSSTTGGEKVVLLGFPFETITTAANRSAVMARVLDFFGALPPSPAPASPLLAAGSDTGTSASDGITRLNNASPSAALQFEVGGTTAGALVKIFADGLEIGSATATGSTTIVTTNGALALGDGQHVITARQMISGQPESIDSAPATITIDTVAPAVQLSTFAFTTVHQIALLLNEDVGASIAVDDLLLENLTAGNTIDSAVMSLSYEPAGPIALISFPGLPGGILPDGNYRATFSGPGITDVAGNPIAEDHVLDFFFLNADANRDGTVNLADFNILAANFGQTGRNFAQGNFDYDAAGNVNLADFNILAGRFGTGLSAAGTAARTGSRLAAVGTARAIDIDDEKDALLD